MVILGMGVVIDACEGMEIGSDFFLFCYSSALVGGWVYVFSCRVHFTVNIMDVIEQRWEAPC